MSVQGQSNKINKIFIMVLKSKVIVFKLIMNFLW